MDLKQIERLMSAMERTGMKRVILRQEGFEIELEKEIAERVHVIAPTLPTPMVAHKESSLPVHSHDAPVEDANTTYVTSPIVGTFYSATSPDDAPFVKVGDQVDEESVACIIEAMKVMNEVKAGVKGSIAEMLVKNGDPVEFGTKLFRVQAS